MLLCPVLSMMSCSSTPEWYKRLVDVALREWFVLYPLIPANLQSSYCFCQWIVPKWFFQVPASSCGRACWLQVKCMCWSVVGEKGSIFFKEPDQASLRVLQVGMMLNGFWCHALPFQATRTLLGDVLSVYEVSPLSWSFHQLYLAWCIAELPVFLAATKCKE